MNAEEVRNLAELQAELGNERTAAALFAFAGMLDRCAEIEAGKLRTATGLANYTMCHEFVAYIKNGEKSE